MTAKKLYNIREGWTAAEDTLPNRFLTAALPNGASRATLPRERLQRMINAYYVARGWQPDGRVPQQLIDQFELAELMQP